MSDPLVPIEPDSDKVGLGEAMRGAPTRPSDILEEIDGDSDPIANALAKNYPDIKLTKDQAIEVRKFLTNLRLGGSAGVMLICANDNCEYKSACPLYKAKQAPAGLTCPLEASVIMSTREQLAIMVDLESNSPVVRSHINEICQIAALEWRCQMKLAFDFHDIMQMVPAAITPAGDIHTKPEMSPIVMTLNELSARRSRLLKELASTPEAKWRKQAALGEKEDDSLSRRRAAQRRAVQEAQGILPSVIEPPAHVKQLADSGIQNKPQE